MAALPKVLVYGAGQLFRDFADIISQHYTIVSVVETLPKAQYCEGYPIISVDEIEIVDWSLIVIASHFHEAITQELSKRDVAQNKIRLLHELPEIQEAAFQYLSSALRELSLAANNNSNKITVRFVINSLGGGGAEKSLISLLSALPAYRYAISVLVIFADDHYKAQLPEHVNVLCISDLASNQNVLRLALRHASSAQLYEWFNAKTYDHDVAYLEGWATKIVASSEAPHRVAWCHTNLLTNHWTQNFCFSSLEQELQCYATIDDLVFVSRDAQNGFQEIFSQCNLRQHVIGNFIARPTLFLKEPANNTEPHFFSIGRLVSVKGYDRLLVAFRQLLDEYKHAKLTLFGDGPDREDLINQANSLNLDGAVTFAGFVSEPFAEASGCSCFISASHTEGHPLAIAEALLCGFPVIATNCGGNTEILEQGKAGLLVDNNVKGLLLGMTRFCSEPKLASELKEASKSSAIHVSNDEVLKQITALLTSPLTEIKEDVIDESW